MRQLIASIILVLLFSVGCAQVQKPSDNAALTQEPLDKATLNSLRLASSDNIQLQPGDTYQFGLIVVECCYVSKPVKAPASWSITPAGGAHIDAHTGLLTVDKDTPDGSVFTVTADVENGRRILSIKVYVYAPKANPLVGLWRERSQIKCRSNETLTPKIPIEELELRADGTFSVTWTPFERYQDYWGTYSYDVQKGEIKFVVDGGNYVPPNIKGSGSFSIDDKQNLVLKGVWLGSKNGEAKPDICSIVFSRH